MSIIGSPSSEFARPVADSQSLKEAYDLLFTAWKMVTVPLDTPTGDLENTITRWFYDRVQQEQTRRIDEEARQFCYFFCLSPSATDGKGNLMGHTDMQIQFGTDPRQRFTLEAKLLNKSDGTNTGAYVGFDGMNRFIRDKKYGIGVSEGGMIGYVLDADTEKAKQNVTKKIEKERQSLGMHHKATLKTSSLREDVYETSHVRHTKVSFTIYHIFLPVMN